MTSLSIIPPPEWSIQTLDLFSVLSYSIGSWRAVEWCWLQYKPTPDIGFAVASIVLILYDWGEKDCILSKELLIYLGRCYCVALTLGQEASWSFSGAVLSLIMVLQFELIWVCEVGHMRRTLWWYNWPGRDNAGLSSLFYILVYVCDIVNTFGKVVLTCTYSNVGALHWNAILYVCSWVTSWHCVTTKPFSQSVFSCFVCLSTSIPRLSSDRWQSWHAVISPSVPVTSGVHIQDWCLPPPTTNLTLP